ncbi:MAG: hypothetical protein V4685_04980 [Bacteroidota bacterium]
MEKYGQLFESVFKRKLTDDSTAGYLKNVTKEHPYFSIAQFYLLSLSQKDVNGYKAQAKKTTVLFNNNHWLNFQLLEAGYQNQSPTLERSITEQQPVFGNTYDKVLSEEKMEEPGEKIIEEQYQETITTPSHEENISAGVEEQPVIEPIEEKAPFNWQEITIEKPVEEINIPVVEEAVPVIEEEQPNEQTLVEQTVEEVSTVSVEQSIPVIEEEPQPIEEPLAEPAEEVIIPVAEEINLPVVEDIVTAREETPQQIEEPIAESTEEIIIPVEEEINMPVVEDTVTAMEETPQLIEEPIAEPTEEIIIPVEEKIDLPVVEDTTTSIEETAQPIQEPVAASAAASMEVKTEPVNEPLLFEPLHTTDYFASVGIKLSEEERTSGSLGKQLKSFTEWLKSMKKVHAAQLAQTSIAAQVEAGNTENSIQNLAEKSNEENDVITEAMADVLLQQGRQGKALEILEKLSLLNPGKSTYFAAKINQIKEK